MKRKSLLTLISVAMASSFYFASCTADSDTQVEEPKQQTVDTESFLLNLPVLNNVEYEEYTMEVKGENYLVTVGFDKITEIPISITPSYELLSALQISALEFQSVVVSTLTTYEDENTDSCSSFDASKCRNDCLSSHPVESKEYKQCRGGCRSQLWYCVLVRIIGAAEAVVKALSPKS